MKESEAFDTAHVIDMWVAYLEQFPHSDITIQALLNNGYSYDDIITLFKQSLQNGNPSSSLRPRSGRNNVLRDPYLLIRHA